jgi:hypothetical protein
MFILSPLDEYYDCELILLIVCKVPSLPTNSCLYDNQIMIREYVECIIYHHLIIAICVG